MGALIGIDLGTCYSAVAMLDETGRPTIIHNQDGQNITPSCVAIEGSTVLVGEVPRRIWASDQTGAAARFKRDMGTATVHRIGEREFSPTELSAFVLQKVVKDAVAVVGSIASAVVTIPANFANDAREATIAAAKSAGLNIRDIVNEPTAAALYYAFKNSQDKNGQGLDGHYVVYDLGGGTFDVSVIKVVGQNIDVIVSNGVVRLGGDDFDRALQELAAKKFKAMTGRELGPRDYTLGNAEDDKRSLSSRREVSVDVGGQVIKLTREEFEQAISSRIAQAEMLCEATLEESSLSPSDIKAVFLAGGSTRIPSVKESIRRVFKQEPTATANVDEVVALGAALYVAYKAPPHTLTETQRQSIQKIQVQEVSSKCYGTISLAESDATGMQRLENTVLISKNEKIPCSVSQTFYTASDGQTAVLCRLTETTSAETDPQFAKVVWSGDLELPPGRPAGQPIVITYSFTPNQTMKCNFVDQASGRRTDVEISLTASSSESTDKKSRLKVE